MLLRHRCLGQYRYLPNKYLQSSNAWAKPPTFDHSVVNSTVTRPSERAVLGDQYDASLDLVFPNGYGGIMIPHNITKRSFKQHLAAAGLPRSIRFHDLRHTAATLLLARGVHPKVVSEMLGHADISITLRVYAHVLPHMQQSAMAAMAGLIGELAPPAAIDSAP